MGTYTTNYNLFMPTVGEQGWGELVNGNFLTIDSTMKRFDDVLSKMTWDGDNVTFPGNVTVNGYFSGMNDYIQLNGIVTTTETDYVYATSATQYLNQSTSVQTVTVENDYTIVAELPIKITDGIYITSISDFTLPTTRQFYAKRTSLGSAILYFKESTESSYTPYTMVSGEEIIIDVTIGKTYNYYLSATASGSCQIMAGTTYYVTTKSP